MTLSLWETARALPNTLWLPILLHLGVPIIGGIAWRTLVPVRSLRLATLFGGRFAVLTSLLLAVLGGAAILFAVRLGVDGMLPSATALLLSEREKIERSWQRGGDSAPISDDLDALLATNPQLHLAMVGPIACVEPCNALVARGAPRADAMAMLAHMRGRDVGEATGVWHDDEGAIVLARSALRARDGTPNGLLVVGLDASAVTQRATRMAWEIFAGSLVLVVLATVGASEALQRSLATRVESLIQALDRPAHLTTGDDASNELVRLAAKVDGAVARAVALEAEVQDGRQRELVGRIAGGIAHEFNNLMTVILGRAEFAARTVPATDPLREDLDEIHQAGTRASKLTAQLLQASGRQFANRKRLECGEFVSDLLHELRSLAGPSIRVHLTVSHDALPIDADARHLAQVLRELTQNAARAMPAGGVLSFTATRVALAERLTGPAGQHLVPGPYARLDVRDTGTGIPADVLPRIFEPFYSTQPMTSAPGLGLAAARGVLLFHGGMIDVTSAEGGGTCVTLYLPLMGEV